MNNLDSSNDDIIIILSYFGHDQVRILTALHRFIPERISSHTCGLPIVELREFMIVIFVHGWSVRHTNTYGDLPQWLESQRLNGGIDIQVSNIFLSRYISFDDTVTIDDIARAFDQAVRDEIAEKLQDGQRFACITHSTGGPVIRKWIDLYFKQNLSQCPLSHLIMLAPANHGSALAQLGKSRLGRIKSFFDGVEPGQHVLNWLEHGSDMSWKLNESWLDYDCTASGVYAFVLTGQKIDRHHYDAINSYTGESGSDGVVRVAATNMNYSLLRLHQGGKNGENLLVAKMKRTKPMAFGVLPGLSHSGKHFGVIRSVTIANAATHPTAIWILRCLKVKNLTTYNQLTKELEKVTKETQRNERVEKINAVHYKREYITNRYSMIIFRLIDDRGNNLDDYDLYLTAGPKYSEHELPRGFFIDRQQNLLERGKLTYFIDYDIMKAGINTPKMNGNLGFRVKAYPQASNQALAYYRLLDFKSSLADINKILHPNETVMVEIMLQRIVDKSVFYLSNNLVPTRISRKPNGNQVD